MGASRYVDRDFATLRACFPVESKDDEEHGDKRLRMAPLSPGVV